MSRFHWLRAASFAVAHIALACCVSVAHAAERVYVLSQSGAALSAIEEGGDAVAWTMKLDKAPASFAFSADHWLAYVSHPDLSQVSVVDLATQKVLRKISVAGSPFGVALTSKGRLFVGDWSSSHVAVFDGEAKEPSKVLDVGRAPAHLLLTPDEKLLFVANRESNSVSAVRVDDLAVVGEVAVGHAPFAMAISPDGSRLYVGNVQGGTVSVIDTAALKVLDTVNSGAMPYGAAVTPDGARVLVTNQQARSVSLLEKAASGPVEIKVGEYPEGVGLSADGSRAYVANWFSDDVSVIDLTSLKEVRRIKCAGGPRGIAVVPVAR
jgi:YVTN family beta-propeller protein